MIKTNNNDLKKKGTKTTRSINGWKNDLKKDLFGNTKYNNRSEIYKLTLSGVLLSVTTGFSLIEIHGLKLPWGADFDYRIFDTLLFFIGIRMIGLLYTLIDVCLMPWIHGLIDGSHSVISLFGFMLTDLLCVLAFWLIYYKMFAAGLEQENISLTELRKHDLNNMNHEHKFKPTSWTRKIMAMVVITIVCSVFEAASQIMVFEFWTSGLASANSIFGHHGDDYDSSLAITSFFRGINILWLFLFFVAAFSIKYIIEAIIFLLSERRTAIIADHYGVL